MSEELQDREEEEAGEYWLSVADLMSGLMIVFLFVAISYMLHVSAQRERVREVVVAWYEGQDSLYRDLEREFAADLVQWNAELDSSLTIRFKAPDVLFAQGSAQVRQSFREVLLDFFPRYVAVVRAHQQQIEEIRIEGHTSSEGPVEEPYYYNMQLSQDRTRAVLHVCLEETDLPADAREWARQLVTANGLSSSRLILGPDSTENRERSRRVEFRVRTNAERRIARILEEFSR